VGVETSRCRVAQVVRARSADRPQRSGRTSSCGRLSAPCHPVGHRPARHVSPPIDEALEVLARYKMRLHPGSMSTLVTGEDNSIIRALNEAFAQVADVARR
jgi:hypothetical protein